MILGLTHSEVRLERTAAAIGDRQIFPMQTILILISGRFFKCEIKPLVHPLASLGLTLIAVQFRQPRQCVLACVLFLRSWIPHR